MKKGKVRRTAKKILNEVWTSRSRSEKQHHACLCIWILLPLALISWHFLLLCFILFFLPCFSALCTLLSPIFFQSLISSHVLQGNTRPRDCLDKHTIALSERWGTHDFNLFFCHTYLLRCTMGYGKCVRAYWILNRKYFKICFLNFTAVHTLHDRFMLH